MGAKEEIAEAFAKINVATNNIAADIQKLSEQISGGLSAEEAAGVAAQLSTVATQLEAIAAVTPDGEPTPPPVEG